MSGPATVAVVLAAGGARRYGGDADHKLLAEIDGRTLATHAIDAAREAAIGPVIVVTGPVRLTELISDPDAIDALDEVENPRWADGQATSLSAAIDAADRLGAEAIVVGLADQPGIPASAWRAVAAAVDAPIGVATYGGRRRNPVRLHRSVWPLIERDGDAGARTLIGLRPDLVREIPCAGSPADIDTLEDLRRWQSRSSTNSP